MNYDPDRHHRRSIRLKEYDYSRSGAYFVTVVTQGRACLFGEIVNVETRLNDAGHMIEHWWYELKNKFPAVENDEFVIMPNHFHGIVVIADVGADLRVGPDPKGAHPAHQGTHAGVPLQGTHPVRPVARRGAPMCAPVFAPQNASQRAPLPTVLQWFKTMTTNEYMRGIKTLGWIQFQGQLWQRNYYEHVIRDEESLNCIRGYILDNPARWEFDHENPAATTLEPEDAWRD
jgi:REP element-mobilizing transposase RayT